MAGILGQSAPAGILGGPGPWSPGILGAYAQGDPASGYTPTRYAVPGQPNMVDRFIGGLTRMPAAAAEGIWGRIHQLDDALAGRQPMTMDDMIGFGVDMAGLGSTGALAAPAVRGGVGMGVRAYHGTVDDIPVGAWAPGSGGKVAPYESSRLATWFTNNPWHADEYARQAGAVSHSRSLKESIKTGDFGTVGAKSPIGRSPKSPDDPIGYGARVYWKSDVFPGQRTYITELNPKNPKIVDQLTTAKGAPRAKPINISKITADAKAAGHDAVIIRNVEVAPGQYADYYGVFDKDAILWSGGPPIIDPAAADYRASAYEPGTIY